MISPPICAAVIFQVLLEKINIIYLTECEKSKSKFKVYLQTALLWSASSFNEVNVSFFHFWEYQICCYWKRWILLLNHKLCCLVIRASATACINVLRTLSVLWILTRKPLGDWLSTQLYFESGMMDLCKTTSGLV